MEQIVYYNQKNLWDYDYMEDPANAGRFMEIAELIPESITTILDVGCGNGSFLNYLSAMGRFDRLAGLDSSEEALNHVKTERVTGTSSDLPFKDKEFDLVTCLEVLEHLSIFEYWKTLSEIKRVARHMIIISVPNGEDLELSLVKCPSCQCRFNPYYHKRSFDIPTLAGLFEGAQKVLTIESGPVIKYRKIPDWLMVMTQAFKIRLQPQKSVCPQCGYQKKFDDEGNDFALDTRRFAFLKAILKAIRVFFKVHSKKRWLFSVYSISGENLKVNP